MKQYNKEISKRITEVYEELTNVEKNIADFFMHNKEKFEFSAKNIAARLYVSEASLSRFSKKCGYKGFREFIYHYETCFEKQGIGNMEELTKEVLFTYQDLLDKSLELVNETQMHQIARMLSESKRVFVYGMGSSGIAAQEFKLRFMRLGLRVEAICDTHMIKMNSVLVDGEDLIIAFSLSGTTKEILTGVQIAKAQGAKIVLITANPTQKFNKICDEILLVAATKRLEIGTQISPQFPILVMVDIFYTYYLNTDFGQKSAKHIETTAALYGTNIF